MLEANEENEFQFKAIKTWKHTQIYTHRKFLEEFTRTVNSC